MMIKNKNNRKWADEMTENNHDDELTKMDLIIANILVISLIIGLIAAGYVLIGMTY